MANSYTTQILQDGPRNAVVKATGILDTADLTAQVVVDPALLNSMQPAFPGGALASKLSIKSIDFTISDGTDVQLYWDATSPVLIDVLTGRGKGDYREIGFQQNNAGAGVTGKITLTTKSNATPSGTNVITFTLILWCVKEGVSA